MIRPKRPDNESINEHAKDDHKTKLVVAFDEFSFWLQTKITQLTVRKRKEKATIVLSLKRDGYDHEWDEKDEDDY